ncbi:MAG: endolytic transglycosylase MltG [Pseudomonadota bacterium]
MKAFRYFLLCVVLIAAGAAGGVAWWLERPLPLASDTVELSIEPGTTPRDIANGWAQAGVRAPAWALYEWFRWSGESKKIRAGSYEVDRRVTPRSLLDKMVRGDETMATVRLIEGWTFRQFRAELAKAQGLQSTIAPLSDEQVMAALGVPGTVPEGQFYPDTYAFSKGTKDTAVLVRAHRAMQRRLAAAWAARTADLPLRSEAELLILASIVEKETGAAVDRAKVAAVFVNRLRVGMPLQTDPTVIYGLGEAFDGNLRKRDLQADTPYNTYTRNGLPPTPIAMPGKAALQAAGRPDPTTKALFFVARGDGTSAFSDTLADHNRAVNKYQRGR